MSTKKQEVVYGLTRGDEKVFYVGKTRNLHIRLADHRRKYGKDISAVILQDSFKSGTADFAEFQWIKKLEASGIENVVCTAKHRVRRIPEDDRKNKSVFVRFTIQERLEVGMRAKALDRKLAEFVRLAALKVAREGQTLEPPPGPESETEE